MDLIVLLATALSAGLWLMLLRKYDRIRPEPLTLVLKILLFGGFGSVFVAGLLNISFAELTGIDLFDPNITPAQAAIDSLFTGLNEEFVKFAFTVLLVRRLREFDEPIDGVMYATAVALGFAAFENLEYTVEYGMPSLVVRSVTAVPLHLGAAAIWGYGIAKARFIHQGRFFTTSLPHILLAAAVHALYNFSCVTLDLLNPALSLLISISFGGALFFFIHKRLIFLSGQTPDTPASVCGKCGVKNIHTAKLCQQCGEPIIHEFFRVCRKCNIKLPAQDNFCWRCGQKLEGPGVEKE